MTTIPVTWPAENSTNGEVSRLLTALLATDPSRACVVANRAQQLARVRAFEKGLARVQVTMADWTNAIMAAGEEFMPPEPEGGTDP